MFLDDNHIFYFTITHINVGVFSPPLYDLILFLLLFRQHHLFRLLLPYLNCQDVPIAKAVNKNVFNNIIEPEAYFLCKSCFGEL